MTLEWLVLNSVPGLGPARIARLVEALGSAEAVVKEPTDRLVHASGFPREILSEIRSPRLADQAQQQRDAATQAGVDILTLSDDRYPPLLREIFAPPPVLFVKGSLAPFARHAVGVVGTRNPSQYGRSAATVITEGLVARSIVITSGLARGIDGIAHQVCLEKGGATVAVLACGIDQMRSLPNSQLLDRIVSNGCVISEFPMGTHPEPYNFPRRNRIISGLSAGVVVVEAGQRSGALITANYALQQGRDVFAVPGSIFADKCVGTFNLIKNGAVPVRTADDILEAIQVVKHGCAEAPPATRGNVFPVEILSEREQAVFGRISDSPARMDQIMEATGAPVAELFDVLLNLELKGAIRQMAGQQYVRC